MRQSWNFSQHFSMRASTVILACMPALVALDCLSGVLSASFASHVAHFVAKTRALSPWLFLLMATLSFTFLASSVARRSPQVQFFVELAIALQLAVVTFRRIY